MLKNLRCSVCDKYLSVLPVKVYPNRVIKCGRCCEDNDGGTESLYNNVVKNYLFKCINRYEKCNKLLTVSEVAEHEKECISGSYHCPKCEYKFSGSAYHLLLHYANQHPKSIVKNCNFSVKVKQNICDRYLHLVKDNIFFILLENLPREKILYLSTVSLVVCKNVKQWFSIKPLHKSANVTTTEVKPCCSLDDFQCDYFNIPTNSLHEISCRVFLDLSQDVTVVDQISLQKNEKSQHLELKDDCINPPLSETKKDTESQSTSASIQTMPMKDVLGVELTEEFRNEYPGYELTPCGTAIFKDNNRVELACSNCKQLTGSNIFNCQSNRHIVCWECKAWCSICDTSTNGWNVNIAAMNDLLLLPCRWKCGQNFLGSRITQHELTCIKFKSHCPVCNNSGYFNLEVLCNHLFTLHRNYKNASHFNLTGYLKECQRQTNGEVYFFQNDCWFKMCWSKKQNIYEVRVVSLDDVDLCELAIVCDNENKKYNKITNNSVSFVLSDNPRFYLKRVRNL